ncbi:fasciclin domain-containing protein [Aliidiomarina sedimenti]|uniref:fasciclin domain-containing protein n=1 Tax=Aliidiomarina sedimenti TaxID=1933879 RepID=UPI001F53E3CD|nr:fasciclin domain-containing protein [Aliidiomarina sedimenti]
MLNTKLNTKLATMAAVVSMSVSFGALANHHGDHDKSEYDIVKVAQHDERFSTFVTALEAAGMSDALDKDGSYTVFAPTNDAFAALPEGTLDALLDDTDQLRTILSYHVVADEIASSDVPEEQTAIETINGGQLQVQASYGNVMVNTATVVHADIEASNGVIHGIDAVIVPAE